MIDSLVVSGDCKDLDYAIIDGSGAGTTGNLVIKDFAGVIPTITTAVTFAAPGDTTTGTVTLGGNGVFEVQWDVAAVLTDANGLVVHCDIDCCLAALTRELVECDCNCAKCSKALAKAQKIFLLLNSAQSHLLLRKKMKINRQQKTQKPQKSGENFYSRLGGHPIFGVQIIKCFFSLFFKQHGNKKIPS